MSQEIDRISDKNLTIKREYMKMIVNLRSLRRNIQLRTRSIKDRYYR